MPQRPIDNDEIQRVSSYLLTQGEKYSWVELWPRVVDARIDFLNTLNRVSPEQAAWKPDPDHWSIEEVAQHVLDGSKRCADLVAQLSQGRDPTLTPQEIGAIDPAQRPADRPFPHDGNTLALLGQQVQGVVGNNCLKPMFLVLFFESVILVVCHPALQHAVFKHR